MGPVVSVPTGGGVTVWATLTVWETVPVASVAVTVMLLIPAARGMFKADQFVPLTAAEPEAPVLENQVTAGVPLPPVTVPESDTVVEVVVEAERSPSARGAMERRSGVSRSRCWKWFRPHR